MVAHVDHSEVQQGSCLFTDCAHTQSKTSTEFTSASERVAWEKYNRQRQSEVLCEMFKSTGPRTIFNPNKTNPAVITSGGETSGRTKCNRHLSQHDRARGQARSATSFRFRFDAPRIRSARQVFFMSVPCLSCSPLSGWKGRFGGRGWRGGGDWRRWVGSRLQKCLASDMAVHQIRLWHYCTVPTEC